MRRRDLARATGSRFRLDLLRAQLRPDPLGLALLDPAPLARIRLAGRDWLPIRVSGHRRSTGRISPARRSMRPFSPAQRGARPRCRSTACSATAPGSTISSPTPSLRDSLRPDGLIFHMSRCGSTLVSQMIAALPNMVAISEARPLDASDRAGARDGRRGSQEALVRAMVARARAAARRCAAFRAEAQFPAGHGAAPVPPRLPRCSLALPLPRSGRGAGQPDGRTRTRNRPGIDAACHLRNRCRERAAHGRTMSREAAGPGLRAAADAMAGGLGLAVHYRDLPGAISALSSTISASRGRRRRPVGDGRSRPVARQGADAGLNGRQRRQAAGRRRKAPRRRRASCREGLSPPRGDAAGHPAI